MWTMQQSNCTHKTQENNPSQSKCSEHRGNSLLLYCGNYHFLLDCICTCTCYLLSPQTWYLSLSFHPLLSEVSSNWHLLYCVYLGKVNPFCFLLILLFFAVYSFIHVTLYHNGITKLRNDATRLVQEAYRISWQSLSQCTCVDILSSRKPLSLDVYWSAAVVSSVTGHFCGSPLGSWKMKLHRQLDHLTTQIQIDGAHMCPALAAHFPLLYSCV